MIRRHGLIVEFDGAFWHSDLFDADREKTEILKDEGWDVIRVIEKPLELISPTDVSVAVTLNAKPTTDAVLSKIQSALAISSNKIDAYLRAKKVQNKKASEAFVLETSHRKQQQEIDRLSNSNTRDEYF